MFAWILGRAAKPTPVRVDNNTQGDDNATAMGDTGDDDDANGDEEGVVTPSKSKRYGVPQLVEDDEAPRGKVRFMMNRNKIAYDTPGTKTDRKQNT